MFSYDEAVAEQYPSIRAGVIIASGLTNDPSSPDLQVEYREAQEASIARLQTTAIADLPSIAAWRRAFTRFGAKPTQYRNAAESLQRRLEKQGEIPSISTLVDLGNLVSIRYALPVAIFDRAKFADAITVRIATGDEPFVDLGSSESVHPEPGEVIFVDGDGVVCARRWCWRQSAESAVSPETTQAMIVIEGHHETAEADIRSAIADMKELLARYQAGSGVESFELPE